MTQLVHGGGSLDWNGALETPIVLSSAYAFESADDAAAKLSGQREGAVYSRWRNPTVDALEGLVAAAEGAEDAVALSSGMGAVHAAVLGTLRAGERLVAPTAIYAESARLFREVLPRFGFEVEFVDQTNLEAVERALAKNARVLYAETPANPTLAVTDLRALANVAHAHGAALIVDGTFATPWHQRPLELGADLVLHSATKALCGHGDAVGGVIAGRRDAIREIRAFGVRTCGAAMAPQVASLIARGMRTLGLRMERASANALELATRLARDPRVERVHYPGLAQHPGHALARAQMRNGFGAMLAFEARGGLEAGKALYDAVEIITRAVSLGDVRSLLTHAATTTHASMSAAERAAAGASEGLLRMSVGIEDVDDLWRDLDRGLSRA
jgi:methionine-gamma-lyase